MAKVSLLGVTPEEKEMAFGREFRDISMLDFEVVGEIMHVRILIEGKPISLIGNPQDALKTYLGGQYNLATN